MFLEIDIDKKSYEKLKELIDNNIPKENIIVREYDDELSDSDYSNEIKKKRIEFIRDFIKSENVEISKLSNKTFEKIWDNEEDSIYDRFIK